MSIDYNASALAGTDLRKLGIYRQDPSDPMKWTYIGGVVDTSDRSVFAEVPSIGTYAVLYYQRSFPDLREHWSKGDIDVLISRRLVNGVSEEQFQPDRAITRAELTKLLTDYLNRIGKTPEGRQDFEFRDVPPAAWYADIVEAAARYGLAQGDGGRFRPNDPVTREEMAAMFVRALVIGETVAIEAEASDLRFEDDAEISEWARSAVASAVRIGLLKGTDEGRIEPKASATRAQAAVILLRVLNVSGLLTGEFPE